MLCYHAFVDSGRRTVEITGSRKWFFSVMSYPAVLSQITAAKYNQSNFSLPEERASVSGINPVRPTIPVSHSFVSLVRAQCSLGCTPCASDGL